MTRPPFEVARLSELARFEADPVTIPIRIPLGIRSFGVNAYAGDEPGARLIEEHDELGAGAGRHEELYFVLAGHATFTLAGENVDAPSGTFVFVRDPAVRRGAVAEDVGTTVLVVGGAPGRAFAPSPWESWLAALPHYQAGEYARAVETMREALAAHPGNPNVLYNLACVESLAGDTDAALTHLAAAVERDPRARGWAADDADLDALRGDGRFLA